MKSRRRLRGDPDTDRTHSALVGGGVARDGSVAVTAAVVVGFHAVLAALVYPMLAAAAVGLAVAAFGGGVGLAAWMDDEADDGDRQVCVPGTATCVDV